MEQTRHENLISSAEEAARRELEYALNPPSSSPAMQRRRGEFTFDDPETADYVEPGNSEAMLQAVINRYFRLQAENLPVITNRLDRLKARDLEPLSTMPRSTIAVTIALHNEHATTLQDTLAEIASQNGVEQDEILLYGNMPESLSEQEKAAARARFDMLVAKIRQTHPHLTVRSIAEEYAWDEEEGVLMGKLRHDIVDLITLDAAKRGLFRIDHPVIFFDADTKKITKTAVEKLTATLTAPNAYQLIAHLETHYLFDADTGFYEDGTMSDVRKLAIIQEIRRRQWRRICYRETPLPSADRNKDYSQSYDEEWGAAIALGPLLIAGNFNERGKWDELKHLKGRILLSIDEISEIMRHAKPGIKRSYMALRPYYLVGQAVRSSGRRQEEYLRRWLAGGVDDNVYEQRTHDFIQTGLPYEFFSHTEPARHRERYEHPHFQNSAQARRIAAAILQPDTVPILLRGDIPMPHPESLLRRYGLPLPDETASPDHHAF